VGTDSAEIAGKGAGQIKAEELGSPFCRGVLVRKVRVDYIFSTFQGYLKLKNAEIYPTFSFDRPYLIIVCSAILFVIHPMG
jgi:hypothetical protein